MKLFFIIALTILIICTIGISILLRRINKRIKRYDILPDQYESDIDSYIEHVLISGGKTIERLVHTALLGTLALYRHSISYIKNNPKIKKIIHSITHS